MNHFISHFRSYENLTLSSSSISHGHTATKRYGIINMRQTAHVVVSIMVMAFSTRVLVQDYNDILDLKE